MDFDAAACYNSLSVLLLADTVYEMISVIIPVYNEEKVIRETLANLPYNDGLEVIVVDGGSIDRTLEFAGQFQVKIITSQKGRALQMNAAAKSAQGDAFIFLHGDCILEKEGVAAVKEALAKGYDGGCLTQRIRSPGVIFRWIEASGNIRARLFKIFYGDQAIFVRRDVFLRAGGFDEVRLFDDVIFSRKLKRMAKVCVLDKRVYTSARRWQKEGVVKATVIHMLLTLGLSLGIHPNILKKIYPDIR